jgi:hypothetical protein
MGKLLLAVVLVACSSDEPKEPTAKEKAVAVAKRAAQKAEEELAIAKAEAEKARLAMEAAKNELGKVTGEREKAKADLEKLLDEVRALQVTAKKRMADLEVLAQKAHKELDAATTDAARAKARAFLEKIEAEKIVVKSAMAELVDQVDRIETVLLQP